MLALPQSRQPHTINVRRASSSNLLHRPTLHHCRDDDPFFPQNIDPDYHESSRLLASTVLIEPDRQHPSSHFSSLIFCLFNGCSRPLCVCVCVCGRDTKDAVQDVGALSPYFLHQRQALALVFYRLSSVVWLIDELWTFCRLLFVKWSVLGGRHVKKFALCCIISKSFLFVIRCGENLSIK